MVALGLVVYKEVGIW